MPKFFVKLRIANSWKDEMSDRISPDITDSQRAFRKRIEALELPHEPVEGSSMFVDMLKDGLFVVLRILGLAVAGILAVALLLNLTLGVPFVSGVVLCLTLMGGAVTYYLKSDYHSMPENLRWMVSRDRNL
ncbi:MAG: hypothetical protein KJN93_06140 [Alphaproteobacteria bacterium]|nr:hypothetical protein [Alphaproteobacteria bacterium]